MKEILARLTSQTPKFFKIIRNISLSLATLGGLIIATDLAMPDSFVDILSKIITISGITAAFIAQLPTIWGVKDGEVVEPDNVLFTINPDTKPNPPTKP